MRRVVQKDRLTCGAAALAMLLGKRYDTVIKELRSKRIRHKNGMSAMDLLRYLGMGWTIVKTRPRGKCIIRIIWWDNKGYENVKIDDEGSTIRCKGRWRGHWVAQDERMRIYDPTPHGEKIKKFSDFESSSPPIKFSIAIKKVKNV